MGLCGKAPDMSGVNAAAAASSELGKEALAWYKEQAAAAKPMQDRLDETSLAVSQQQLASMKANDALASDYANYNKTTFRPLEQGIVADAAHYDTPEKRQAAAEAAMADVNKGFAATNDATARTLAANGVNPGSTRAMSVMSGRGVDQAVAGAGAAYKARQGVETVGHAMQMDAASLGRNLPSAQATSAQVAMQTGNSAVNNAQAPVQTGLQGTNVYGGGYSTAIGAQGVAGNLYGKAAEIQGQDNGLYGALGTVAGAGISKYSDVNLKSDIEPEDPEAALQEVAATPVSKWKYDPAKLAANGVSANEVDPGEHTGPMAQDVNAQMGDKAAPGGKKIDLVTMNGKTMLAVQALNKKVDSLAAMIRGGQIEARAA